MANKLNTRKWKLRFYTITGTLLLLNAAFVSAQSLFDVGTGSDFMVLGVTLLTVIAIFLVVVRIINNRIRGK